MEKTILVDDCLVRTDISEPVLRIINEVVSEKENGDHVKHNYWNDEPRHDHHRNQGQG